MEGWLTQAREDIVHTQEWEHLATQIENKVTAYIKEQGVEFFTDLPEELQRKYLDEAEQEVSVLPEYNKILETTSNLVDKRLLEAAMGASGFEDHDRINYVMQSTNRSIRDLLGAVGINKDALRILFNRKIPRFLRYPLWSGFVADEKAGHAYTAAAQRGVLSTLAAKHTSITQHCQEALDLALAPSKRRAIELTKELSLASTPIPGAGDLLGSTSRNLLFATYSSKELKELPPHTILARGPALSVLRDTLSFLASRTDPEVASMAQGSFAAYRALPCVIAVLQRNEDTGDTAEGSSRPSSVSSATSEAKARAAVEVVSGFFKRDWPSLTEGMPLASPRPLDSARLSTSRFGGYSGRESQGSDEEGGDGSDMDTARGLDFDEEDEAAWSGSAARVIGRYLRRTDPDLYGALVATIPRYKPPPSKKGDRKALHLRLLFGNSIERGFIGLLPIETVLYIWDQAVYTSFRLFFPIVAAALLSLTRDVLLNATTWDSLRRSFVQAVVGIEPDALSKELEAHYFGGLREVLGVNISFTSPSDPLHHQVKSLSLPALQAALPDDALEARIPQFTPPQTAQAAREETGADSNAEEAEEGSGSASPRASKQSPRKLLELAMPKGLGSRGSEDAAAAGASEEKGDTEERGHEAKVAGEGGEDKQGKEEEEEEKEEAVELPRTAKVMSRTTLGITRGIGALPAPVAANAAVTPFPTQLTVLRGPNGTWSIEEEGAQASPRSKPYRLYLPPFYPHYDRLLVYLYNLETLHVSKNRRKSDGSAAIPQAIPSPSKSTQVQPFKDAPEHDQFSPKDWNALLPVLGDWLGFAYPELVDPQAAFFEEVSDSVKQQHWVVLGEWADVKPLKVLITVATASHPHSGSPRRRSSTSSRWSKNIAIPLPTPEEDVDAVLAHYISRVLPDQRAYVHSLQFDDPAKSTSPTGRASWVDVPIDVEEVQLEPSPTSPAAGVRHERTAHALSLLRAELIRRSTAAYGRQYKAPPSLQRLANIITLSSFGKAKQQAAAPSHDWHSKLRTAVSLAAALRGKPRAPAGASAAPGTRASASATPRRKLEESFSTIASVSEAQQKALMNPLAAVMKALHSVIDVTEHTTAGPVNQQAGRLGVFRR